VLRELLGRLGGAYVVLGNHDVEHSRDPFSRAAGLTELAPAHLLVDEGATVRCAASGCRSSVWTRAAYRQGTSKPWELVDPSAGPAHPACHSRTSSTSAAGASTSSSQATCTTARSRYRSGAVASTASRIRTCDNPAGLYRGPTATLHVSPGLGTTFVPFRFFARPEATELVLQREPE
jgi:hypothetical protein